MATEMPTLADKRVIVCNVGRSSSAVAKGAHAYLRYSTGAERAAIFARSRGGRYVAVWGLKRELAPFRVATVPPEHPMYRTLDDYGEDAETIAAQLNAWKVWKYEADGLCGALFDTVTGTGVCEAFGGYDQHAGVVTVGEFRCHRCRRPVAECGCPPVTEGAP